MIVEEAISGVTGVWIKIIENLLLKQPFVRHPHRTINSCKIGIIEHVAVSTRNIVRLWTSLKGEYRVP
mgnify:CR=1 FL=1